MRVLRALALLCIVALSLFFSAAQQASSAFLHAAQSPPPELRDAQALLLLQRSLASMTGTTTVKDVTLRGTANWIAGADNESGSAVLKATAIGQSRIDLALSSGNRSEVRDVSTFPPTGRAPGLDGTLLPIPIHNLYSDPSWFFPSFLFQRVLSATNYTISSAISETKDGIGVQHLWVSQENHYRGQFSTLIQPLERVDIYLNSTNLLPVAIEFDIHPDNSGATSIAVEIKFSEYRTGQGSTVPYHIQRYLQHGLVLDLAVQAVEFNSGLQASEFAAQ